MMIEEATNPTSTVSELIRTRKEFLNLSDQQVTEAAGYASVNVIKLLVSGQMRLAIRCVPRLAKVLGVSRLTLMRMVLDEISSDTRQAVETCFLPLQLTEEEEQMVMTRRELAAAPMGEQTCTT